MAAVVLRVEHWAELDSPRFRLMYDANDRKKTESRGTEAVVNALILARRRRTRAGGDQHGHADGVAPPLGDPCDGGE